jgi:hypothetical protein
MSEITPKSYPAGAESGELPIVIPPIDKLFETYSKRAEIDKNFSDRVQLFRLNPSVKNDELYLILTGVTNPEEVAFYQNMFQTSQKEIGIEDFLVHVNDANKNRQPGSQPLFPENLDSENIQVYKIFQ